jgi:hypothetical protein
LWGSPLPVHSMIWAQRSACLDYDVDRFFVDSYK